MIQTMWKERKQKKVIRIGLIQRFYHQFNPATQPQTTNIYALVMKENGMGFSCKAELSK